jgi:MFS family permease
VFGSLAAHYFTDTYGRRKTFFIAAVGFIFGLLVTASATSFNVLLLGRLFVGLGVGIGLAVRKLGEPARPLYRLVVAKRGLISRCFFSYTCLFLLV